MFELIHKGLILVVTALSVIFTIFTSGNIFDNPKGWLFMLALSIVMARWCVKNISYRELIILSGSKWFGDLLKKH